MPRANNTRDAIKPVKVLPVVVWLAALVVALIGRQPPKLLDSYLTMLTSRASVASDRGRWSLRIAGIPRGLRGDLSMDRKVAGGVAAGEPLANTRGSGMAKAPGVRADTGGCACRGA